mmetsp:Transcript_21564/g.71428  ORF Transcript_21564/g.71428 Transcript_21564/m.71428 type:complete len:224 (-) Transcript_21564:207-878(-)
MSEQHISVRREPYCLCSWSSSSLSLRQGSCPSLNQAFSRCSLLPEAAFRFLNSSSFKVKASSSFLHLSTSSSLSLRFGDCRGDSKSSRMSSFPIQLPVVLSNSIFGSASFPLLPIFSSFSCNFSGMFSSQRSSRLSSLSSGSFPFFFEEDGDDDAAALALVDAVSLCELLPSDPVFGLGSLSELTATGLAIDLGDSFDAALLPLEAVSSFASLPSVVSTAPYR